MSKSDTHKSAEPQNNNSEPSRPPMKPNYYQQQAAEGDAPVSGETVSPKTVNTPVSGETVSQKTVNSSGMPTLRMPTRRSLDNVHDSIVAKQRDEEARIEKRDKRRKMIGAIGQGISAFANLWATNNYAPNAKQPNTVGMMQERMDRLRAERKADNDRYLNMQMRLAQQGNADAENDADRENNYNMAVYKQEKADKQMEWERETALAKQQAADERYEREQEYKRERDRISDEYKDRGLKQQQTNSDRNYNLSVQRLNRTGNGKTPTPYQFNFKRTGPISFPNTPQGIAAMNNAAVLYGINTKREQDYITGKMKIVQRPSTDAGYIDMKNPQAVLTFLQNAVTRDFGRYTTSDARYQKLKTYQDNAWNADNADPVDDDFEQYLEE